MGVYTTFYCVVGVHKKISELIDVTKTPVDVPSCSHSEQERSGAFCSKCGIAVTVRSEIMKSQAEWDFEEYMLGSHHVLGVDWNHGREEHSFLIGHYKSMHRDAPKTLREFQPNPYKGLSYITKVIEGSPVPVIYKPTLADVTQFMYMDVS